MKKPWMLIGLVTGASFAVPLWVGLRTAETAAVWGQGQRAVGDTLLAFGAVAFVAFVSRLARKPETGDQAA